MIPISWQDARAAVHTAGARVAAGRPAVTVPLADADGLTLAGPLVARTPLPAFPTSSIDGYAVRGTGPWRLTGRILAGRPAPPLTDDGTCAEIATGAMVPEGTTTIVRVEHATDTGGLISGEPHAPREWRDVGEEAAAGEDLLAAGTAVTPGVLGLAASCGYDELAVVPAPRVATIVFGDELLTAGDPGDGRVRDALGPQVPGWLRRLGAVPAPPVGPVPDTLEAHLDALRSAIETGADVICTTGGTMQGPVDHLHPALAALGAEYVVNQVAVRPGFPMLVAKLPDGRFVAGLPGNPQSAIVALVSLVVPLLAGLSGRPMPVLPQVTLGARVPGRGDYTHLALVAEDAAGAYAPLPHAGSSMLRGLSRAAGFAVVPPHSEGTVGARVALVRLP